MNNIENITAAFEAGLVPLDNYEGAKDFFSESFPIPYGLDFDSFVNENMCLNNNSASPGSPGSPITPYERAFQPLPSDGIPEIPPPLTRTESTASSSPAMDTLSPSELNLSPSLSCQPMPSLVDDVSTATSTLAVTTPVQTPAVDQPQIRNAKPGRPKKQFTGTRNTTIAPVAIDAPTVDRKYVMPSATSRKEVPRSAGSKKRRLTEAELNEDEVQAIEAKRRQNTVAARISRQRKAEHLKALESEVARLQGIEQQLQAARAEALYWKEKASTAQFSQY